MTPPLPLSQLFWIFFRIACTSFGGYMAMISVVQNVVVERKKLMTHADMLDGISLASILPGPVAVNLVAYVGYRLRRGPGAFVCVIAAVLPSFVFIMILSIAYFRYGQMPAVSKLFMGFIPAVTAIIVAAAWNMGRKAVPGVREGVLMVAAGAALYGIGGVWSTLLIILFAGVAGWMWFRGDVQGEPAKPARAADKPVKPRLNANLLLSTSAQAGNLVPLMAFEPNLIAQLFLTFASMSLMLFGGAYVFIPLMQEIVVDGHGWVSQQEFIDAVALGQITPGPILVSAAFIGLKVAGFAGAAVATIGIYLPSALLIIGSTHGLQKVRHSVIIKAALRGIRPAVVGMIFVAAVIIGQTAVPVWISVVIFVGALYTLFRFRVEAVWIIPPAGVLAVLFY
ncbi:MAG: chromate efflux transporter [Gammaproteobacteria bacterium]|nr:chromate efflux transporter [Gammaproteobacteria bacterium]MDH3371148.1 chromate efflux transporter [Gammaproteobacteria bacterium]MDH3406838.1 chromate efflux transporter [Gammaproteobacteria bacterium]MDH3563043.1 chromate efflux transporter [Gammaproteobacteria bacterium]MDH5486900.1 chromate efflux transporter [Gammaproteobacteria bacterium]